MSSFHIVILVLCFLTMAATGLWLIVEAFRQSILWGLAYLFVPFAGLVFIVIHWSVAKTPFLLSLGASVAFFGILLSTPEARTALARSGNFSFESHEKKAKQLTGEIQDQRDLVDRLQNRYATENTEVTRQYQALMEKRKTLKADDADAVHGFNLEAAEYKKQNAHLSQTKHDLDAAVGQVGSLLDERAKVTKRNAPTSKQVVMYTTSTCPACRAAKDYLTQKGVNYREFDLNVSAEGREEFRRLGGQGVPLILIGDRRMDGFSSQAIDAALSE